MDGKIDTVREALNELQGLIHHIERTTGHEYDSRKLHAALAALSTLDPEAIRRECLESIRSHFRSMTQADIVKWDGPGVLGGAMSKELFNKTLEYAILSAEPAPASTPWSWFEIGMLAAMMTGNLDKDTATLTGYLAADPAQGGKDGCARCRNRPLPGASRALCESCKLVIGKNYDPRPVSSEPAQDDGKPILPMFPLQNGNEGDWIIDFDFLMAIQKEYRDADDYGKPSLEEIEETLLVLMRSAEVKRRIEEAKE